MAGDPSFVLGGADPHGLSDDAILDALQRQTLTYFWDFAHPISGMARERSNAAFSYDHLETVTTGGTGFGIMALIAGTDRGFLPPRDVQTHIHKIADFLASVQTHQGVFAHFYNGSTGAIIPFMPKDDGGDLVETAFLMMGLLTARQYFSADEELGRKINALWHAVDWRAHCRDGDCALIWHASPNHPWTAQSLDIRGWNECLVTFVLAAGSPTAAIDARTYTASWLAGDTFVNGRTYDGIVLPLGPDKGGPLFLSQYSFLGLDPRGLRDDYADYFMQGRNHTLINRAHCIANPHGFEGYGANCWGLSASDSPGGYAAHSPTNDLGVISPTAALSAIPYTPQESMAVLRHFAEDRPEIWGPHGPLDAFSPSTGWVAQSNLAIDQGPIAVMVENHRSGLLWTLFMSCPEVRHGLATLGLRTPHIAV